MYHSISAGNTKYDMYPACILSCILMYPAKIREYIGILQDTLEYIRIQCILVLRENTPKFKRKCTQTRLTLSKSMVLLGTSFALSRDRARETDMRVHAVCL